MTLVAIIGLRAITNRDESLPSALAPQFLTTETPRAVSRRGSTVAFQGVEVDDARAIGEQADV